mmetsp:Transcript_45942/g.74951  ORF Transcript_45942/g.74951 Transcript_45942/m.74951 type:complete len:356 (+) Transcript_45942:118-1185(+)
MAPAAYPLQTRLTAFFGLVAVQVAVGVIYKASGKGGKYDFSPASSLTLSEFVKLMLSYALHVSAIKLSHPVEVAQKGLLQTSWATAKTQASSDLLKHSFGLAALYCLNNHFAFYLFLVADPASISLFKSGSTFISAILLFFFLKRPMTTAAWGVITIQVFSQIIVQYDPVKGVGILPLSAYVIVFVSVTITSVCSVWNENMIKTLGAGLNVQNAVLYAFGTVLNLMIFFAIESKGFFEGYNVLGCLVVFTNGMMGIAITAIYKYTDAVMKTFASATTTGVLIILSSIFFGLRPTLTSVLATGIVFISTYLYFIVQSPPPAPVKPAAPPAASTIMDKDVEAQKPLLSDDKEPAQKE